MNGMEEKWQGWYMAEKKEKHLWQVGEIWCLAMGLKYQWELKGNGLKGSQQCRGSVYDRIRAGDRSVEVRFNDGKMKSQERW